MQVLMSMHLSLPAVGIPTSLQKMYTTPLDLLPLLALGVQVLAEMPVMVILILIVPG